MFLATKTTEEEAKADEELRSNVEDKIYEYETGMPAISRYMPSADQL